MPIVFSADGIETTRDLNTTRYTIDNIDAENEYNENTGVFTHTIDCSTGGEDSYKSFDIYIEYTDSCNLDPDEYHIINLINNSRIDAGDNIIINNTSGYSELQPSVYNIDAGKCSIKLLNISDVTIPHTTYPAIKLTVTIIN